MYPHRREQLDKDRTLASMANKGIKWYFNKPRAEEYIKSQKKAIGAIYLDLNSDATEEELISDLTGAEKLMFYLLQRL